MDYSGRVAGRQVMSFVELTLADGRGRCVIVHYTKRLDGMSRHAIKVALFALVLELPTNRGRQSYAGKLSGRPPRPTRQARQGKSSQGAPSLSGYEWRPRTFLKREKCAGKNLK